MTLIEGLFTRNDTDTDTDIRTDKFNIVSIVGGQFGSGTHSVRILVRFS